MIYKKLLSTSLSFLVYKRIKSLNEELLSTSSPYCFFLFLFPLEKN